MTTLRLRNVDASPDDPVETWPFEGVLAALERGTLPDWQRLAAAIVDEPWGDVARQVEEALALDLPYGVGPLTRATLEHVRGERATAEREEVAREIRRLLVDSGRSRANFASRIGTSTSRLSTYLSGSVTPSAALMVRMRAAVS
jgi:hypothetical protein